MNPRSGRQFMRGMRPSEGARRQAKVALKGAGKRLLRSISRVEGDAGHQNPACFKLEGRPLQSQPANVVHDRFADYSPKDAMEVVLREAGDPSQSRRRQFVIQMSLHVCQHFRDCGFVFAFHPAHFLHAVMIRRLCYRTFDRFCFSNHGARRAYSPQQTQHRVRRSR